MQRGQGLDPHCDGLGRSWGFATALGTAALVTILSAGQAAARCGNAGDNPGGLAVSGAYIGETFATLEGGLRETATYDGLLALDLHAALHRFGLWEGLCLHASCFQIHGRSITQVGTGSLAAVSSIEAQPTTRLDELWLEQTLLNGKASLRLGELAADTDFLISDWAGHFLNATWGWPTIAAGDLPQGGPAYPLAAPGARFAYRPNDDFEIKLAIFNGLVADPCRLENPQLCNEYGLEFPLGDDPLLMAEAGYRYKVSGELPGRLSLGGWHHKAEFSHQRFDVGRNLIAVTAAAGQAIDGNYGAYVMFDQLLWRPEGTGGEKGIGVFTRVMAAPEDRNLIDFYADAGVVFRGLIPHRPDDTLAIGFAYSGISDQVSAFDVDSGRPVARNYEALIEATYTFRLRLDWTVQPDIQYFWQPGANVIHPSDKAPIEDALVVGVRSAVAF